MWRNILYHIFIWFLYLHWNEKDLKSYARLFAFFASTSSIDCTIVVNFVRQELASQTQHVNFAHTFFFSSVFVQSLSISTQHTGINCKNCTKCTLSSAIYRWLRPRSSVNTINTRRSCMVNFLYVLRRIFFFFLDLINSINIQKMRTTIKYYTRCQRPRSHTFFGTIQNQRVLKEMCSFFVNVIWCAWSSCSFAHQLVQNSQRFFGRLRWQWVCRCVCARQRQREIAGTRAQT